MQEYVKEVKDKIGELSKKFHNLENNMKSEFEQMYNM